jgi:hypothetical protein
MRQASQASKTRVLRLKEPLSVRTDQFCRIGRAEPHNPAGISAHATHKQHRPRFYTAWTHCGHSSDGYADRAISNGTPQMGGDRITN